MRVNMPVTNVERHVPEGASLVSRTDLKGIVTYANRAFVEMSGFSEPELIGAPHNIVRHPDMPPEAFEDLWATLQAGERWHGLVKNRCKNGDHYWVDASVNPVREDGRVSGYMSVRTRPTRAQIEQAERLYRRFREKKARGLGLRRGEAVRTGVLGAAQRLRNLSLKARIVSVLAVLSVLMLGIGVAGLYGINAANEALYRVYQERMEPAEHVARIEVLVLRNRIQIMRALLKPEPELIEARIKDVEKYIATVTKLWEEFNRRPMSAHERQLAETFATARGRYVNEGLRAAAAALHAGRIEEARRIHDNEIHNLLQPVREGVEAVTKLQFDLAEQEYKTALERYRTMRAVFVAAIVLGALLAALSSLFLLRAIHRPLVKAVETCEAVSAGDLGVRIDAESRDEFGRLMLALKGMVVNLAGIVHDALQGAGNISTASQEISRGNADLSQRTQEQASALEQTASSMEQMTSAVTRNADNAQQANQLAAAARERAERGGAVVGRAVAAVGDISQSSRKIADIIGVINEIAFQTNLLALNAAVEAARAGEQGRGFAVVAGEVRNLAQRSAQAAKEIKALIADSVEKVEIGTALVNDSGKTLEEIVTAVKKVSDIVSEIAAASGEQSAGIGQVNKAVMQMDEMTQQNAALVEQAAAASQSLEDQARGLRRMMEFFRIGAARAQDRAHAPAAAAAAEEAPGTLRRRKAG